MKKKLNLDDLKVKSFVTDLKKGIENTAKGGISGGACVPAEPLPIDTEWVLGTRGGCTVWENMC